MNLEYEKRSDLIDAADTLHSAADKVRGRPLEELRLVLSKISQSDRTSLKQLFEAGEIDTTQAAPVQKPAQAEVRSSRSLADYYINDEGKVEITSVCRKIYSEAGLRAELVDGWVEYFKSRHHNVNIEVDDDLGLVIVFSDNSSIGLVLPSGFDLRSAQGFEVERGFDPSSFPVVLKPGKAQKESGRWKLIQRGKAAGQI